MKTHQKVSERLLVQALAILCGAIVMSNQQVKAEPTILFQDDFASYPVGLLTNEHAFENPTDTKAHFLPKWEVTSGSLFALDGAGYTGVPDRIAPGVNSSVNTDSAVFRCRTKADNFGDVQFSLDVWNDGFASPPESPAKSYDGIHLWLRYISDKSLYSITINRRDNIAIIKKKIPGGPSNGGTYFTLKSEPYTFPLKAWQHFTAISKNNADGSVAISLLCDGKTIVSALDDGTTGGAPITAPGHVGVRGDNCQFKFDNVIVKPAN